MHVSIASRLAALRKQRNLSQEELAEKIGVSRQAISKWERAEASPDTDNLILLARLYQVSLDDLLLSEELPEIESTVNEEEPPEYEKEPPEYVSIGLHGIHVKEKNGTEVHIGRRGIHVNEKGCNKTDYDWEATGQNWRKGARLGAPICLCILILYYCLGFFVGIWHPTWLVFFLIPIILGFVSAIHAKTLRKKLHGMPVPFLATAIYLYLGFYLHLWAQAWIVFLFIPLYYVTVDAFCPKKGVEQPPQSSINTEATPED